MFVATSHERMGVLRSRKTGIWLEDFVRPCEILTDAGCAVTSASPLGGDVPVDPESVRHPVDAEFDPAEHLARVRELLRDSIPLGEIDADDYDA